MQRKVLILVAVAGLAGALSGCGTFVGYARPDLVTQLRVPHNELVGADCVALSEINTTMTLFQGKPIKPGDPNVAAFNKAFATALRQRVPLKVVPAAELGSCKGLVVDVEIWDLHSGEHDAKQQGERIRTMLEPYRPQERDSVAMARFKTTVGLSMAHIQAISMLTAKAAYGVDLAVRIRRKPGGEPLAGLVINKTAYIGVYGSPIVAYAGAGGFAGEQTAVFLGSLVAR